MSLVAFLNKYSGKMEKLSSAMSSW